MKQTDFDFLVIGGGSAGFHAARVAREHAERVAIVDGAPELGGLCILRGCMPSKTLLYSAEVLHLARQAKLFGLQVEEARVDPKALHARKVRIIEGFASYRRRAILDGRFTVLRSRARFLDPHMLWLSDGSHVSASRILIATGSEVAWPNVPGLRVDGVWTSDDVLDLDAWPESVIVLGGGVVACELAQFLRRIGARTTLIQRSPRLLREFTPEVSATVEKAFLQEGMEVVTGTRLRQVRRTDDGFEVEFEKDGRAHMRRARHVLNALGRRPATTDLGLEAAGIALSPSGHIPVNSFQQTILPHVYAAGDCAGPHEIVHLAVAQGELAARHALGRPCTPIDYEQILTVVFTDPAVAVTGTPPPQGALAASYPFDDHGKSILMERKLGHVRVWARESDGRILAAEIVGPEAGELIHVFSTARALGATVFDMLRAPWYHPTLAEIVTYPLEELADALRARGVDC